MVRAAGQVAERNSDRRCEMNAMYTFCYGRNYGFTLKIDNLSNVLDGLPLKVEESEVEIGEASSKSSLEGAVSPNKKYAAIPTYYAFNKLDIETMKISKYPTRFDSQTKIVFATDKYIFRLDKDGMYVFDADSILQVNIAKPNGFIPSFLIFSDDYTKMAAVGYQNNQKGYFVLYDLSDLSKFKEYKISGQETYKMVACCFDGNSTTDIVVANNTYGQDIAVAVLTLNADGSVTVKRTIQAQNNNNIGLYNVSYLDFYKKIGRELIGYSNYYFNKINIDTGASSSSSSSSSQKFFIDDRFFLHDGKIYNISDFEENKELSVKLKMLSDISNYNYACILHIKKETAKLKGTARGINNQPVARKVRAFRRGSGELVAETMTDERTGDFEIQLPDRERVDVQFMAEDGELLNDLIQANVTPENNDD